MTICIENASESQKPKLWYDPAPLPGQPSTNRVILLGRVIAALHPSDRICAVSCRALEATATCMQSRANPAGILGNEPIARGAERQKREKEVRVV
jgi:hypothetical protein